MTFETHCARASCAERRPTRAVPHRGIRTEPPLRAPETALPRESRFWARASHAASVRKTQRPGRLFRNQRLDVVRPWNLWLRPGAARLHMAAPCEPSPQTWRLVVAMFVSLRGEGVGIELVFRQPARCHEVAL